LRQVSSTIWLAGFLLAASAACAEPASERYGEEYQSCKNGNTRDIVLCVDKLVKKWDARLNAAYQKLLGATKEADRLAALKKAQKLWVGYRDANCGWHAAGEGTIHRLEAGECMRSMTADRALELETEGETN
jgi:uncharacterized protein YecT (DUF1311 family)